MARVAPAKFDPSPNPDLRPNLTTVTLALTTFDLSLSSYPDEV